MCTVLYYIIEVVRQFPLFYELTSKLLHTGTRSV